MKAVYIISVLEMINNLTPVSDILSGLQATMKARGHEKLYTAVLSGVLRILEAKDKRTGTFVVVAREADATKYQLEIQKALKQLNTTEETILVDDSLIGGVIIKNQSLLVDNSFKTKLVTLYRNITK